MTLLDAAWSELDAESARAPGRGVLVRRVFPDSASDIWAGLEQPGASRLLLVTVPRAALDRAALDLGSAGIDALVYSLNAADREHVEVGVRLRDRRFVDLFSALAADVVEHLAPIASPAAVAPALFGRLFRWQQFLKRLDPEGLGPEAQRGLYAELMFLRQLWPLVGPVRAVSAWSGPLGADQDFQLGTVAVEVKSASGHQLQEVHVASERQLDDRGLDHLLVYFVSLDVRRGGGETLVEAVDATRALARVHPQALELLEKRLLEAGYISAHRQRYELAGYTLRGSAFFRVADGFPRIIESDLRQGVGGVRYTISVAQCEHFAIPGEHAEELLRSAVSE